MKGRKRHLLVDTQGLVLEVRVHSAKVMDRGGIKLLLDPSSPDRLPAPAHPIGWLFGAVGLLSGMHLFCGEYAVYALVVEGDRRLVTGCRRGSPAGCGRR